MDLNDIYNFLPKYPNILNLNEEIFNPYNDQFNRNIYFKKEFYENRLPKIEPFPNEWQLMKHQKLVARFFSSHTLYDNLLLFHEMGSGKTCVAIGAIEHIRYKKEFKGALYLAKGDSLLTNFTNEFIFKCTDGRYIPENYETLSEGEKLRRKRKAINEYYLLNTFETFAKKISLSTDEFLQENYNNRVIVIDEVHNLRIKAKEKGLNIYNQFYRFLHVVKGCKILLMSGTPMKNNVDEISSVMNLLLPEKDRLPSGVKFITEYFDKNDKNKYVIKKDKINNLKKIFRGRVSYLKAMQSQIEKNFAGKITHPLKHLKIECDFMSPFQSQSYDKAYKLDIKDEKEDQNDKCFYTNSRQASLFVFPNGTYGPEGFNKYFIKIKQNPILNSKKTKNRYKMTRELVGALKGKDNFETLINLKKYSSKYAASIETILQAQRENKSVFVYNKYVKGSGLILFGAILELFGFSKATGMEGKNSKLPRYATLSDITSATTQIEKIVSRFNEPDNMQGKIINVFIGSHKISEGFSLQNVQVEDIHTPWYNYSETSQAIARGIRLGSHNTLLSSGIIPKVDIYQRVSKSTTSTMSIDLQMYKTSEDKDISIKIVERLMKISAWDCALNYKRNHIEGKEGKRECDYIDCDYECDGIPMELLEEKSEQKNSEILDNSTFQLYYSDEYIAKITKDILLLFRKKFKLNLSYIIKSFPEYLPFDIITTLYKIINESIQVINRYGFPSYLKEENNFFFLVDSLKVIGSFSSEYYTEFPSVKKVTTFNKEIEPFYNSTLPAIINQISEIKTPAELNNILKRLPLEVHEFLLEASILASEKKTNFNLSVRKIILEYFVNYYTKIDGKWVSYLLTEKQNKLPRCLNKDTWEDCDEYFIEKLRENKKSQQQRLKTNNPYGFYGQFNRLTDDFCIRSVENILNDGQPLKKHKETSGRKCINWKKEDLLYIIIDKMKIPIIPKDEMSDDMREQVEENEKMSKTLLEKKLKNVKTLKNYVNIDFSKDDLLRILFWGKQKSEPMCFHMKKWFEQKNLLIEDSGCGAINKKKPEF